MTGEPAPRITTVLFDLDGTIIDSAEGILSGLRRALDELGLPRLDHDTERSLIGPPVRAELVKLFGHERSRELVTLYRRYYGETMFKVATYDGITEVIEDLLRRGVVTAVATSKPEPAATAIITELGLADHFATVCGHSEDHSRQTKTLVVSEAMRRLGSPSPTSALMVGDRFYDVHGARDNGIGCLGAGWGYGLEGELTSAGVLEVFDTPAAMLAAHDRLFGS